MKKVRIWSTMPLFILMYLMGWACQGLSRMFERLEMACDDGCYALRDWAHKRKG